MKHKIWLGMAWLVLVSLAAAWPAGAAPRIKDIGRVGTSGSIKIIGYGLVIGLDGTGDSKGTEFTVQSVVNMLSRMGITVPQQKVRTKNVAAVIVSADLAYTAKPGVNLDVTVSSLGDAGSLEGGTLLLTPLAGQDEKVYAHAQGPVSVGGFKVGGSGGDRVSQNYTLVGRVPGGAAVDAAPVAEEAPLDYVNVLLFNPDYTTASRISEAIRSALGDAEVKPVDPGLVRITVPAEVKQNGDIVNFIARIETTRVEPDVSAVVVINEKTGTIVAGDNVTIGAVAIAHGNLSIQIQSRPVISQPEPFSPKGETVVVPDTDIDVQVAAPESRLVALDESASVADVARALNLLGVSPRDIIAIFQALKEAGALRADIRII
jgi:flagellar P-ring protein precursor FlgI